MKKMKIFALIVLAGATMFTSCKKDDTTTYANPTVSFQSGINTLTFNLTNSISSNVTLAAEAKIESVKLLSPNTTGSAGNSTTDITTKMGTSANQTAKGETSAIYLFNVSTADIAAAFLLNSTTTLTYTFTVTDQAGTSSTGSFTVTAPAATGNPINTYTAKLLGAQGNAAGSFLASAGGAIYSQAQAAANAATIDITYGVIGTASTILSLPERGNNGFTAVTGGPTVYYKVSTITGAQFDAMTDDLGFANITASTTPKVTVANGDVIEFVNGSKKGLIKVTALTTGTSGSITLNVKVQQ